MKQLFLEKLNKYQLRTICKELTILKIDKMSKMILIKKLLPFSYSILKDSYNLHFKN